MPNKKTRSKDPHSWIKDTTKKAAEADAAAEPEEAAAESGPRRCVTFEFDPSDGRILATHEVLGATGAAVGQAPRRLAEGKASACIALAGELRDKPLLDLHRNYKVVISDAKPTLVPKG